MNWVLERLVSYHAKCSQSKGKEQGWGKGPVVQVLTPQAQGHEFNFQDSRKRTGCGSKHVDPSAEEAETRGSLELTRQPAETNRYSLVTVSKTQAETEGDA